MKVLHQLYLTFIWCTIIAARAIGETRLYPLKFNHSVDNIDTIVLIKNGSNDDSKTVFAEFKRNNSTFCVWEHEKHRSTNAILITLPEDVESVIFRGGNRANKPTIVFGIAPREMNSRQFVLCQHSFWIKNFHEKLWFFKMHDFAKANRLQSLPTCNLQIEFQTTSNLHDKKYFNVELVTALMVNTTTAPTASPSALPTALSIASPSTSSVSNENSDESTMPMEYKILVCIFISVFLFLSLLMCLNKNVRQRFCTFCSVCGIHGIFQEKSQDLTHETVTITLHEMKTRES